MWALRTSVEERLAGSNSGAGEVKRQPAPTSSPATKSPVISKPPKSSQQQSSPVQKNLFDETCNRPPRPSTAMKPATPPPVTAKTDTGAKKAADEPLRVLAEGSGLGAPVKTGER